ncbi:uncharacterized protein E0L32_003747 [Thyridium curvatum]|uniref:Uncharacterized protein n=1 Tax=Thyridium curvatum TaxID=1093900 RepID=A0A507BA20_9PEZI|nr:uncharacterized protein E0L32_003747 [Thyridium curvatum]TPX16453.1 hypothetical protein E0L32_003747 [Thyridium curvatum]
MSKGPSKDYYDNEEPKEQKFLIVGVDYGTTFSGVSYVFSDKTRVEDVEILDQWGSTNSHQKQVPSRIAYEPSVTWGYGVEPGQIAYCWTKLLLDKDAPPTEHDDRLLRTDLGPGFKALYKKKSAQRVVQDYLELLYQHIMSELTRKLSGPILNLTPIHFWFTYPALWSVKAQSATKDAALAAGFASRRSDEIHLIKEPEAGAIACLSAQAYSQHALIRDLASYKISRKHPNLKLEQICVSEGGKCGSTTIDRAFLALMQRRFGEAFQKLPEKKRGINSKFMAEFESAKRDFNDPRIPRTHRLHLKMDVGNCRYYDAEDEEVLLSSQDMKELFDPTIDKIISLTHNQIEQTEAQSLDVKARYELLVGGFGESRYLYRRLYHESDPKGIAVFNPPKSARWDAVCLGAAFRGIKGTLVGEKKSRSHIGLQVARPFRQGIDSESDAWIDEFRDKKMARGYMQWIIAKGETITLKTAKAFSRIRLISDDDFNRILELNIYECSLNCAPDTDDNPAVMNVGTIEYVLANIDEQSVNSIEKPNGTFHELCFEVVIIPEDDLGYMHFRTEANGIVIGTAVLKI